MICALLSILFSFNERKHLASSDTIKIYSLRTFFSSLVFFFSIKEYLHLRFKIALKYQIKQFLKGNKILNKNKTKNSINKRMKNQTQRIINPTTDDTNPIMVLTFGSQENSFLLNSL